MELVHISSEGTIIPSPDAHLPLNMRLYMFKFTMQYPQQLTIKFLLKPLNKQGVNFVLEMETEDFLRNLGLLNNYIELQEQTMSETNPVLRSLKSVFMLSRHILHISKIGNNTIVRQSTDQPGQIEVALKKIGEHIQALVRIQEGRLVILGITDYDYGNVGANDEED
jgi:hypothetical protein